jgi:hypothetical protein
VLPGVDEVFVDLVREDPEVATASASSQSPGRTRPVGFDGVET